MLQLLCILLVTFSAVLSQTTTECPAFGDWKPWSEQCLWFPLANLRQGVADACETTLNVTRTGPAIELPPGFQLPARCGHCSFKLRCKKRDRKEGCYSLDLEKQTCHEFGDTCTMPHHPKLGCRWNLVLGALQNCANKPDIPEYRRDAIRKFAEGLPQGNCIDKDGQCKCCCHPYIPSADGTTCVQQEETQCAPFGAYTPWSQCMWFPLEDIFSGVRDHCQLQDYVKGGLPKNLIKKPEGFVIPEKCGYCSFKARCRKRDRVEGCMSIDADKKACGPEDCPTCGNVCTVPKIEGSCEWGKMMGGSLMTKADKFMAMMPLWKKNGIENLMRHLPFGTCKDIEGQCKCCCHPYEPNAEGTACVPTAMCSITPSH